MDNTNYTSGTPSPVNVTRADYFAIPDHLRRFDGGAQVLRMVRGQMQFTPVTIVEPPWRLPAWCYVLLALLLSFGSARAMDFAVTDSQFAARLTHANSTDPWQRYTQLTASLDPAIAFAITPADSTEAQLWAAATIKALRSALALFDRRAIAYVFQAQQGNAAMNHMRQYAQATGADASPHTGYALEARLNTHARLYCGLLPGNLKWSLFEARFKRDKLRLVPGDVLAPNSEWQALGHFRLVSD